MSKPYRKAKGYGWIWVLAVFLGIGIGIGGASQTPDSWGAWILAITSAPILIGIIAAAVIDNRLTRGRQKRIGALLESLGLTFVHHPEPDVKQAFFGQVQQLERNAGLTGGGANLQWI